MPSLQTTLRFTIPRPSSFTPLSTLGHTASPQRHLAPSSLDRQAPWSVQLPDIVGLIGPELTFTMPRSH